MVTISLPPLSERREDIIPLIDHFRRHFAKRHSKTVKGITPDASRRLFDFDWPGNVRQLRNVVESMVVIDADESLDVDDLPPEMIDAGSDEASSENTAGPSHLIGRSMDEIEKWAIEQTLKLTGGNREECAKILGIGARTLYRKLNEYGLRD